MNRLSDLFTVLAIICVVICGSTVCSKGVFGQVAVEPNSIATQVNAIKKAELGKTRNVHCLGCLYFAGKPDENLVEVLKQKKITRVISLCTDPEIKWDEAGELKKANIEFIHLSVGSLDDMDDKFYEKIRELLSDDETQTLLHCSSATRVGAAWLPFRVLDQGVDLDTAKSEAQTIGLRAEVFVKKAVDYIKQQQALQQDKKDQKEKSVKPGINDNFKDPELNVDEFVKRFEVESREIYSSREKIAAACQIKPGQRVADIGAGTGLFTRQFSKAVGEEGWVFAVDISPRFIEHINADAKELGITNITGVLCAENSCSLPPESVDVVFICDTYHHFEYPKSTMTSIHRALKKDGRLIVIDFYRIPGKSRPWLLGHVRAGKEVFRSEIVDAGFKFTGEESIEGLKENYCLIFKK